MAAAKRPPKEPARAAAEKKRAARKPSSWRLYQQLVDISIKVFGTRSASNLREVVVDTGEQTSLSNTEEPTASKQTSLVVNNTHESHDDTPGENNAGEKDTGRPFLDGNVGERLETGIRNEEDGQSVLIITITHVEISLHVSNTSISNVGTVQEGEQIQQR